MIRESFIIKNELKDALSDLELAILYILGKKGKSISKDIHQALKRNKKIVSPTTVSVFLDRLHKKGLTEREIENCRGGYRYAYVLKISPEKFEKRVLEKSVNKLIQKFGSTAIAYFNERFGEKSD